MPKKWSPQEEALYCGQTEEGAQEELECEWGSKQTVQDAVYGKQLNKIQLQQVHEVISDFPTVIKSQPGQTKLTTHKIITKDHAPIWQGPYRAPQALKEVTRELKELLRNGIVEELSSKWASLMVVIKRMTLTEYVWTIRRSTPLPNSTCTQCHGWTKCSMLLDSHSTSPP